MIYQLKVTLKHTKPPIWRRIEVPEEIDLGQLHEVLQETMGWTNSHLHEFGSVNGPWERRYSDPGFELEEAEDERSVELNELLNKAGDRLRYIYDFGDGWEHEVRLEKVVEAKAGERYPRCTAGKRRGPVEDCGGPWGWENLLQVVNDPENPEYEERREWLELEEGEVFDGEAFDPAEVNARIQPTGKGWKQQEQTKERGESKKEPSMEEVKALAASMGLRLRSYRVNFGAMKNAEFDLPAEAQSQLKDLYVLTQSDPAEAVRRLEALLEKYPRAARLYNYLGAAYMEAGQQEKARQAAEENYRRNPNYLFAKLNFAAMLMEEGAFEKAREVFENKWDISMHYPDREEFHVTEVIGFLYMAGRYFALTDEFDRAETYLEALGQVDSEGPQYEALENLIFARSVSGKMKQMMNRRRKPRKGKGKKRK